MNESWEVGRSRSTCEAAEQGRASGRGGGGGKGAGQGEHGQQNASRTQGRARRAQCAGPCAAGRRRDKEARFTALLHHVDVDRLRAAYRAFNPKAAPGVDGVTWGDYGQDLEANLRDLHERVHRGALPGEADTEGRTSRRRTGGCGRSGSPRWRTRSSSGPSSRCSTRSTRRTSGASPTGFGRGAARTTRWTRWRPGS